LRENGNFGVNTLNPAVSGTGIDVYSSTSTGIRFHTATSGLTVNDGAGINFSAANNLGITNYENGTIDIVTNGNSGVFVASNGFVGINGATPSVALTVNGAISQTSVTSALLKTNGSGLLVAAVAGTDYVSPSALSGYVPYTGATANLQMGSFDISLRNLAVNNVQPNGDNLYDIGILGGFNFRNIYAYSFVKKGGTSSQFLKADGSVDSSSYLTTSAAASTYLALTGGTLTGALGGTSASFSSTLTAGDTTIINVAPILAIQSNTTGNIFLRFRQSADTMASMFYTNATATFTMSNNMGGLRFNTSGTSDAMNIIANGNVGISTTTPSDFIDASLGMAIMSPSGRSGLTLGSTQGTANEVLGRLSFTNTNSSNAGSKRLAYVSGIRGTSNNSAYLEFGTADNTLGSQKMILTQSGSLLIGLTNEVYKLTVANNGLSGFIGATNQAGGTGDRFIRMGFGTGATFAQIQGTRLNVADDVAIALQPGGGNVLIGTTTDNGYQTQIIKSTNGLYVSAGSTSSHFAVNIESASFSPYFRVRGDGYLQSASTYNNTTASPNYLSISSSGFFERFVASSARYKEEIKDWNVNGLDIILALRPRTYKYKKEYYNKADVNFLGLIAEEVAEVNTYLADYENEDGTGQVENVRYATIVVPLIKAVQELEARIKQLENK
jgi:hypothetical protein